MLQEEWAILKAASTGMRTVFGSPASEPERYVEKNFLGMLGLALAIGAIPEIPIHHLLIPTSDWLTAVALDFALLYSAVWVLGVYGVMAQRPHDFRSKNIVFHRGPFARVAISRDCVEHAAVVAEENRQARRRYPHAYYMGVPGGSLVHVRLREPVRITLAYPVQRERMALELLVPSDQPRQLVSLLCAEMPHTPAAG
jgi:hypothetical protein